MTPLIQKKIEEWLDGPYDEKSKAEIRELLKKNPGSLVDAFFTDLSFGTGGLRGIMGAGSNRMNIYTVRKATQGLASYIRKAGDPKKGVIIGFDSRHNSEIFAKEAARVLAGNGIKVYLLPHLRPTPFISFACRAKKCQAGIMITASHNPKEYNGYKVYWSDGGQVVPPHDVGIMEEVEADQDILLGEEIPPIDESLDQAYLAAIEKLQHFPVENKKHGKDLHILYTSLHGTGITLMPHALSLWGFTQVDFVQKQIVPDGDFPTVKFPNPEYLEALQLGIDQMKATKAELFIATDPDADRLGAVVKHQGKPVVLTGNEVASICVYFLCETLTQQNKMATHGAFVTTIVSTELQKTIAAAYNKPCFEVLTGFKYIGEKIHQWESSKAHTFLFGAEESYGFLLGTHARDKDGIVSGCFLAEIALQMKLQGKTLVDLLHEIYKKFGIYRQKQVSINFKPGKEGLEESEAVMKKLRSHLPSTLAGQKVIETDDFIQGGKLQLPPSDVLLFRLADDSRVVIRPSGTEPKIKIYLAARQKQFSSIESGISQCDKKLETLSQELHSQLS